MYFIRRILIIFCCIAIAEHLIAQPYTIVKNYETQNGLPSTTTYRTLQDKNGFLWIATDNGLAKFDGKTFRIYNTRDGLVDNDVPYIALDGNNKIWAFPFKKTPQVYNESADKFEVIESTGNIDPYYGRRPYMLDSGNVALFNSKGELQISDYKSTLTLSNYKYKPGIRYVSKLDVNKYFVCTPTNFFVQTNSSLDTIYKSDKIDIVHKEGNEIFSATLKILTKFDYKDGILNKIKERTFENEVRSISTFEKDKYCVITNDGRAFILNGLLENIEELACGGFYINQVFKDNQKNLWITTKANGIVKMRQNLIQPIVSNLLKTQSCNKIALTNTTTLVGTTYGEIFIKPNAKADFTKLNLPINIDDNARQIEIRNNVIYFGLSSGFYSLAINKVGVESPKLILSTCKSFLLLNDSTQIVANSRYINYMVNGIKKDSLRTSATSFCKYNNEIIAGSTAGLFTYANNKLTPLLIDGKPITTRVSSLTVSQDNILWIGTASDTLIAYKANFFTQKIPFNNIIKGNSCNALLSTRNNELWLGTNAGICKINYIEEGKKLSYTINSLYASDGLLGEQVNGLALQNDSIYFATNKGVQYLPSNFNIDKTNFEVYIKSVKINDTTTILKDNYDLKYAENTIEIQFGITDLVNGENTIYQYKINNGQWEIITDPTISLRKLEPGNYEISLRSINRNGEASNKIKVVKLNINKPFWKSIIFWMLSLGGLLISLFWWITRRRTKEQKMKLESFAVEQKMQELEMQALKAQINPHFIFNCLNSIRSLMLEGEIDKADEYLNKFSGLLRTSLENSSNTLFTLQQEIDYIENYILLEKLRMEDKLDYKIEVADNVRANQIFFPAMLMQPYVENSIKHGIKYLRKKNGFIKINILRGTDGYKIEIIDNGIGMTQSNLLKEKGHSSSGTGQGLAICKRRAAINKIDVTSTEINENNETGNIVTLTIPFKEN